MALIAALLATVAAGLFTGAAVYITFVEHPAREAGGAGPSPSPGFGAAPGLTAAQRTLLLDIRRAAPAPARFG